MKSKVSNDIRGWQQWHCLIRVSVRYSPTMITSLCLAPLCLRYDVTSSYVGTSAISYISLFLHSYMDLLVFLSLLLRRKLLLNPAGQEQKKTKKGLCQCLHSDTSVCTLKLAAVQFDLWSIQCLGKHLRSSMSNTSYCIVQLGFYESCLCCRWKQNRVALGQTTSLDITLKRLIHIFPWCQGWVHFNFLLLWRGYTYLSEKVARSLIKLWVTHPCLFFTHVLILMVS